MNTPHVIIIGAGFGGLSVARQLRDAPIQIRLIDKQNYHLFQSLLHQVAIAGLLFLPEISLDTLRLNSKKLVYRYRQEFTI